MFSDPNYNINVNNLTEEDIKYFNYLEQLRKSGQTNMWGAGPYLERKFNLTEKETTPILLKWIQNYEALAEKFKWRTEEN